MIGQTAQRWLSGALREDNVPGFTFHTLIAALAAETIE
jgi:hypothetical protein